MPWVLPIKTQRPRVSPPWVGGSEQPVNQGSFSQVHPTPSSLMYRGSHPGEPVSWRETDSGEGLGLSWVITHSGKPVALPSRASRPGSEMNRGEAGPRRFSGSVRSRAGGLARKPSHPWGCSSSTTCHIHWPCSQQAQPLWVSTTCLSSLSFPTCIGVSCPDHWPLVSSIHGCPSGATWGKRPGPLPSGNLT